MEESANQEVVPKPFREAVMKVAHGEVAGHLGVNKTYDQILRQFYWPIFGIPKTIQSDKCTNFTSHMFEGA